MDTEELALQRHDGASYSGVIQVIDFCNGKVTGDQLPPESSLSQALEGGNVIPSLLDLVHGNEWPFPLCPQFVVNSWRVGILSHSPPVPPTPCPQVPVTVLCP